MENNCIHTLQVNDGEHGKLVESGPTVDEILEKAFYFRELGWYYTHLDQRARIEAGLEPTPADWADQVARASTVEKKYADDLCPWDDTERGFVCGAVSALEWGAFGPNNPLGGRHITLLNEAEAAARVDLLTDQLLFHEYQHMLHQWVCEEVTVSRVFAEVVIKETQRIWDKYGEDHLIDWSDYEMGILSGKRDALGWMLGKEVDL